MRIQKTYDTILDEADAILRDWFLFRGIGVHTVHYVRGFEERSRFLEAYVFFSSDRDLARHEASGVVREIEQEFKGILRALGYSFEHIPGFKIEFDSHENVQLQYRGSYFRRLR